MPVKDSQLGCSVSENGWVGSDFKTHPVPTHRQGCHPLDLAAQGPSQPALNVCSFLSRVQGPLSFVFCSEVT